MTKEREALKLALDALYIVKIHYTQNRHVNEAITAAEEALAQPPEERNFCPRCGKRAGKNAWDVHTCSPPEEKNK